MRVYNDMVAMIDSIAPPDSGAHKIVGHGAAGPLDQEELVMTVHPNPAKNVANICVEDLPEGIPVVVDVVDVTGATVATLYNATPEAELGLCLTLDCSKLANGTYYAHIQNAIMGRAVKLSVQH